MKKNEDSPKCARSENICKLEDIFQYKIRISQVMKHINIHPPKISVAWFVCGCMNFESWPASVFPDEYIKKQ